MKKRVELNLDLKRIQVEDLAQIAQLMEEEILKHLQQVLGDRLTDCNITIGAEVKNEELVISVDVEVKAYFLSNIDLGTVIDSAIRRAYNAAERFLTRFRAEHRTDTINNETSTERCYSNTC
jgi:siroheme synthase (precorrin-2 oxidase/ferrochelatase)